MDISDLPRSGGPMMAVEGLNKGLQALSTIQDMQNKTQDQALQMEVAQRARKEYEDSMTPIHLKKLDGLVPPDMKDGMLDFLEASGSIKVANNQPYILKKDLKEFMTGFKTNLVAQNIVLDRSHKELTFAREQLKPKIEATEKEFQDIQAQYQQKILLEHEKVKDKMVGGKPMLADTQKIDEIKLAFQKDQKVADVLKKLEELKKTDINLVRTATLRLKDMNINDARYDDIHKVLNNPDDAYAVAAGRMSIQEALNRQYREKKRIEYDLIEEKETLKEMLRAKREKENILTKEEEIRKRPLKGNKTPAAVDTDKYLTSEAAKILTEAGVEANANNIASYKTLVKKGMDAQRAVRKIKQRLPAVVETPSKTNWGFK